jgi:archaellum component FlaC
VADREKNKVKNTIINWRNIDFQTVKQRINQITKQLEEVQKKYEPQSSQLNSYQQENAQSDRAQESRRH